MKAIDAKGVHEGLGEAVQDVSQIPDSLTECSNNNAFSFEEKHVHLVYESIAAHFSASRYKEWPRIASFIQTLPPFSLVADVGCGNGKYFACAQYERHGDEPPVKKENVQGACSSSTPVTSGTLREKGDLSVAVSSSLSSTSLRSLPSTSSSADYTSGKKRPRQLWNSSKHIARKVMQYEKEWVGKVRPTRRFIIGFDRCLPLLHRALQSNVPCIDEKRGSPTILFPSSAMSVLSHLPPSVEGEGYGASPAPTVGSITPFKGADVLCSSMYPCPFRPGVFDAALCIAVIHHLSTVQRRIEAVQQLLRLVKPNGGLVLIYVWALPEEQSLASSSTHKRVKNIDYKTGDAFVPWQMNAKFDDAKQKFNRYYHFFREGELEGVCGEALEKGGFSGHIEESYFDKENWCVVVRRE